MKKNQTPKPTRKPRTPRKSFMERLVEKLEENHPQRVSCGVMSDKSCAWVAVRTGHKILEFTFDHTGEKIQEIGLATDVIRVVSQKMLFRTSDSQRITIPTEEDEF